MPARRPIRLRCAHRGDVLLADLRAGSTSVGGPSGSQLRAAPQKSLPASRSCTPRARDRANSLDRPPTSVDVPAILKHDSSPSLSAGCGPSTALVVGKMAGYTACMVDADRVGRRLITGCGGRRTSVVSVENTRWSIRAIWFMPLQLTQHSRLFAELER